ncbi:MAG: tRNA epoxyqueuosine(34) reductase QueG [Bacteroidota bacterium]|jgi:epoxyqueuosine reductase|nr:tRNA epoxyqueuosine(34) reductase QueG [Bacteroidota bacterium]
MVVTSGETCTDRIRREAFRLGFSHVGVARAEALDIEREGLEDWLARGYHAGMEWIARDPARRADPRLVLEGARSVISVAMNYYHPVPHATDPTVARISRYAWGDEYHDLMSGRLAALEEFIQQEKPDARTRRVVDTAPVMDKAWAVRAGIGWLGKNAMVITRDHGSWIFLGEILTTVALAYDTPIEDYCGTCTSCLDACPTQAIVAPAVVDSARCISYLTIEHRGEHPAASREADFRNWIFGCDICQDVCPWNSFAQPSAEAAFAPRPENLVIGIEEAAEIRDEEFRARFRKSPVKRAKPDGFRRNARTLLAQRESHTD